MIIVDLQQVMLSTLSAQLGAHRNVPVDENLFRHMVINTLRAKLLNLRVSKDEEVVIACDSRRSWRKDVFPYYKAHRKASRDKSELDWNMIFQHFAKVRAELKEFFPYRVIEVEGAEADDIIGVICQDSAKDVSFFGDMALNTAERILIISGDKDFIQLQKYPGVSQYDPVQKRWLRTDDAEKALLTHIIQGDPGDGIPNIKSEDASFVHKVRQKPIYKKELQEWLPQEPAEVFSTDLLARNYARNRQLIDLTFIPAEIAEAIRREYAAQAGKGRDKLFNYFIQYRMKHLMESISEF